MVEPFPFPFYVNSVKDLNHLNPFGFGTKMMYINLNRVVFPFHWKIIRS